jgi:threonine aldolase
MTSSDWIDLRSDTVTRPDLAMRRAMAEAEVGDDVYGEDPTVLQLEHEAARLLDFPAALFVPTGTMGNQIALHLLGRRGTELVCDARAHVFDYELAGLAAWSGLVARTVASGDGLATPDAWDAAILGISPYRAETSVMVIENTHNMAGGVPFGRDRIDPVLEIARRRGIKVHLDGARIFNAATALGVAPAELARGFDSAMFCLSKGLGAPVGSLLLGSRPFVDEARRVRKRLGGGMRQAGVLAAPGLLALREGPSRLAGDHARARALAMALAECGFAVDVERVRTNVVIFDLPTAIGAEPFLDSLRAAAILASQVGPRRIRFVTHRDIDDAALDRAVGTIRGLKR